MRRRAGSRLPSSSNPPLRSVACADEWRDPMEPLRISLGVFGLERLFGGDPRAMIEVAREAEAAGVAQLSSPDQVVMSARPDRYPFGKFPLPPEYPWFEPLTMLAAIAGATSRIRLGTGGLITPPRPGGPLPEEGRAARGRGSGWAGGC